MPRMRSDAVARTADLIAKAYESVHQAVMAPESGYADLQGSEILKHSPAQVRTVLGAP